MKNNMNFVVGIFTTALLLGCVGSGWAGDSLYEYYTDTPIATLKQETSVMGKKLKKVFGQNALSRSQQQIDFAEYYSNLRRMIVYAAKMGTYSEYEKDLNFARDHEVFKGLPEEIDNYGNTEPRFDRKEFVKSKYERLNENITEEIGTYKDLIHLSLDACETLTNNDLSEFMKNSTNQRKVRQFITGRDYKTYALVKERFSSRWPELATRIDDQLILWGEKDISLDTPLVDSAITEAL